ncbi:MAG: hypothetical protein DVB27_03850 [Verrucomicrobia bacterium]|nr:MAG: hypothetical protein DVB27_03850 [Verrucomicrobiota bacterium]
MAIAPGSSPLPPDHLPPTDEVLPAELPDDRPLPIHWPKPPRSWGPAAPRPERCDAANDDGQFPTVSP